MIRLYECRNPVDDAYFWARLVEYFERDLFPDPEDEDREYFLGEEYAAQAAVLHAVERDRLRYFLFEREGEYIGFVMGRIYTAEDHRCYLMEFCVFPQYRGGGTGRACARLFIDWAFAEGAAYIELNAHTEQRRRFWHSLGFVDNGLDDYGDPSLMLPPKKQLVISTHWVTRVRDWQLVKLVNSMRHEQGKPPLTDAERDMMATRLDERKYEAYLADHGKRKVGICFTPGFSTGPVLDMYVEPVFRGRGAEDMLRDIAAQG